MHVSIPVEQLVKTQQTLIALHALAPFTREHEIGMYPDLCAGCCSYRDTVRSACEHAKKLEEAIAAAKESSELPIAEVAAADPDADQQGDAEPAARTFKLCDRVRLVINPEMRGEVRYAQPSEDNYNVHFDDGFNGQGYTADELELETEPAADGNAVTTEDEPDADEADDDETPGSIEMVSSANTRDPRTWTWPVPNAYGVYEKYVPDHVLEYKEGKVHLLGELLEVRPGVWAERIDAKGPDWGHGGGMSKSKIGPTTYEAAVRRLIGQLHETIVSHELSRKSRAWLAECGFRFGVRIPAYPGAAPAKANAGSKGADEDRRDPFGSNVTVDERRKLVRNWSAEKCKLALEPGVVHALQASIKEALRSRYKQLTGVWP